MKDQQLLNAHFCILPIISKPEAAKSTNPDMIQGMEVLHAVFHEKRNVLRKKLRRKINTTILFEAVFTRKTM